MPRPRTRARFAVCVSNAGCEDLQVWKLYKVLPDKEAAREAHLRVVDESGEDYLYPASRFALVEVPKRVADRLLGAAAVAGA
ncbi:MAG: hypothetical protein HY721_02000 [Planctomycetes bacterium]|nr:hypothetical protein [Planctomycetota bacterium]